MTPCRRGRARELKALRSWSARIWSRSWSGRSSKFSSIRSSIWRCWAVAQMLTARSELARRTCSTGASLMTSGRVPKTTRTTGLAPALCAGREPVLELFLGADRAQARELAAQEPVALAFEPAVALMLAPALLAGVQPARVVVRPETH